ncbi:16S rRNA (cytidine(1402)-2'-O)-methyltransferase [Pelistega sp. MC2]|uniref:16S rRNA (cytidine(1402)-2'-O)-methyltransferase n=1 Tax=Pelistega sp. MC2 TaxID=1720297 RepID=UPI0008DB089B|nr:16S rRNA (cytidine(1402)-2'-O)-methyltransferase [Pelistega sp. MC2]
MSTALGTNYHIWEQMSEELSRQYWPENTLYVIATPIGNLADMTFRAMYGLQLCDVIACEDTRTSKQLLNFFGVNKPLIAAHQHNEKSAAEEIITLLASGKRVALISDAGAPAISDPGGKLVLLVRQAGFNVVPVPGASAVVTALMASGLTSDERPGFTFVGFIPPKKQARCQFFEQWRHSKEVCIFFESPHRIKESLKDLVDVVGENRNIAIARELTKRFEQIITLPSKELLVWLNEDVNHQKGEFVLLVSPEEKQADQTEQEQQLDELLLVLLDSLSVKDSVKIAMQLTKLPKDIIYRRALEIKS